MFFVLTNHCDMFFVVPLDRSFGLIYWLFNDEHLLLDDEYRDLTSVSELGFYHFGRFDVIICNNIDLFDITKFDIK